MTTNAKKLSIVAIFVAIAPLLIAFISHPSLSGEYGLVVLVGEAVAVCIAVLALYIDRHNYYRTTE